MNWLCIYKIRTKRKSKLLKSDWIDILSQSGYNLETLLSPLDSKGFPQQSLSEIFRSLKKSPREPICITRCVIISIIRAFSWIARDRRCAISLRLSIQSGGGGAGGQGGAMKKGAAIWINARKGEWTNEGRVDMPFPFVAKNESRRALFNVPRFIARSALAKRLHPQNADSHEMCIKGAHPSSPPPLPCSAVWHFPG